MYDQIALGGALGVYSIVSSERETLLMLVGAQHSIHNNLTLHITTLFDSVQ